MSDAVDRAVLAVLLAAASGLALWNAFDHGLVLGGTAAGAVIGFAAGWEVARQWWRGAAGAILGLLTATGILIVGLAALTGDMSAFTLIPSTYVTFLSIGLPAAGIDGLVIVPASLVAATAFVTVWAAYRGRELVAVATAAVGVLGASLLAGPTGVPWWVAAGFVVTLAAFLVVASRLHYSDLQPLVGTSTVVRRNVKWWRPAFIALPAGLLAAVAWFAPPGAPFDVRQFVRPDVVRVADDNPLAVAARLTDATRARPATGRRRERHRRDRPRRRTEPGPTAPRRARRVHAGGVAAAGRVLRDRDAPRRQPAVRHGDERPADHRGGGGRRRCHHRHAGAAERRDADRPRRRHLDPLLGRRRHLPAQPTDLRHHLPHRARPGVRRRHPGGGAGRVGSGAVRLSRLVAVDLRGFSAGAGGDDDPAAPRRHRVMAQAHPRLRARRPRRPDDRQRRGVRRPGLRTRQPRGVRDGLRAARSLRRRAGAGRRRLSGAARRRHVVVVAGRSDGLGRDAGRRRRVGGVRPAPHPAGAAAPGRAGRRRPARVGRPHALGAGGRRRAAPGDAGVAGIADRLAPAAARPDGGRGGPGRGRPRGGVRRPPAHDPPARPHRRRVGGVAPRLDDGRRTPP